MVLKMLLPNEWIDNSIETYIYQHTTKSQFIYWIVILAIIIAIVLLPFIYVDISIQGSGVVRPTSEKTEITSTISELVDSVYVREGQNIKKGDAILRFRTNESDYKINYQSERMNDFQSHLVDLKYLAKGERPSLFRSPVRQQQYACFLKKKQEQETTAEQAKREYLRNKNLYKQKVISEEEYEKSYYQYIGQNNELASLVESQLSTWQTDLNTYMNQAKEMHTDIKQEKKDEERYIVRSPINGTIDQFSGIYRGSSLQSGQTIAVISPGSSLCVDIYVTPRDIGFLCIGMHVKIQVESFNYNEWGTLQGRIVDISSDYMTDSKGNFYYKVKCKLPKNYLILRKNGMKGYLKKGMTVNAHFMVTRRSLFDLLYQNIDEWFNPAQYKKTTIVKESK
jgi:membrane fusion protein, peptide pheromone/bacteriocin exporter